MKSRRIIQCERSWWVWASLLGSCPVVSTLSAADTDTNAPPVAPPPLTPEEMFEGGTNAYSNWINFSAGGFFPSGNKSQARQRYRNSGGAFGGIEDFHYQGTIDKVTSYAVDGRALFDLNDYKLGVDVTREKLGYLRFSYNEFRTWSSGDGGYHPPTDTWYPLRGKTLTLDRGEIKFEAGLTLEDGPQVTFKYAHGFRDGKKGSTIWGVAHPDLGVTQALAPSFYDLDEQSDAFQLDVAHRLKKTDFGVGVRYEFGSHDDALKTTQSPGEPAQRRITGRQGDSYDFLNAHAFTETWIKTNLLFSTAYSYAGLDNSYSGSRIYGTDFDVRYSPAVQNGLGYYGLRGSSRLDEYVLNLNLMYRPKPALAITPSMRVLKEDRDAGGRGFATLGTFAPTPLTEDTERDLIDVRERLDLTYTGITNWVFHARGDWTEGSGNLTENGGLGAVNGIGVPAVRRKTEDSRWFQKYSAGLRWYPTRRVVLDVGAYYKLNSYDYDHPVDTTLNDSASANRYPAYLVMQDFATYDGNVRLVLKPRQNLTFVSRYEYQYSTIHAKPDSISGLGEVESSKMTTHIFAEDISWVPWSRLHLQAGFNYVRSKTETPAAQVTGAILDAQNNYWTASLTSGFVLDDQSDLNLGYLYYRADDYEDNSAIGVPYGSGAQEHGVTATLIRRITDRIRLSLRYGYFHYTDDAFGGNADYAAHLVYTTLCYRF